MYGISGFPSRIGVPGSLVGDVLADRLRSQALTVCAREQKGGTAGRHPFAAAISADDWEPLAPGDTFPIVTMLVPDDEAAEYLRPGERFDLWCGHDVGTGIVSRRVV